MMGYLHRGAAVVRRHELKCCFSVSGLIFGPKKVGVTLFFFFSETVGKHDISRSSSIILVELYLFYAERYT